ncbi:FAD-dependent monooxygenase [Actinomycetes bacterium KLBMP 9797]
MKVDVAIVGAGPTGLALACELRLAGVTCQVLERRTDEPNITRAFAVHARTLELLDGRGLADRLVPRGQRIQQVQPAPGVAFDLARVDSRYPMVLLVPQSGTERLLEERARELGAEIVRGAEVVGLAQDADGVRLDIKDQTGAPRTLRASYAVGTDGAHSAVRRLLGVKFVGRQYETHIILADVTLDRPPADTLFGTGNREGLVLLVPFGDGTHRAIVWDKRRDAVPLDEPITLSELHDAFRRIAGDTFGMGEPRWRSRFLSERRQAERYRVGRVFLAGDAAHVHSPIGGQGMNTGIQDAMNLGWKLASAVHDRGPADLLDTYNQERHPVGARVLRITDGLNQLVLSSMWLGRAARTLAIRTAVAIPPLRRRLAGFLTGIGIRYASPAGAHPRVGQRVPNAGEDGRRVYEAIRTGQFVLVDRRPGAAADSADGAVVTVRLSPGGAEPALTLVRPDGYVAWASDRDDADGLRSALEYWCGPIPLTRP